MSFTAECDVCRFTWNADDSHRGIDAACPLCRSEIRVREQVVAVEGETAFQKTKRYGIRAVTAVVVVVTLAVMVSLLFVEPGEPIIGR